VAVPSIVLSANSGTINPYARLGLALGILKVKEESKMVSSNTPSEWTREETGNLAFGYVGALGVVIPTGGTVAFFAEAVLNSVTYSPSRVELTKSTVNGVDILPSVDPKGADYKESLTNTEEGVTLAVRRPFSSIGIVVGARINL
jgi:hypothetical protein